MSLFALDIIVRASALLAAAALADFVLCRRASAATRHLVWTLAILAVVLVVLPLVRMVGMIATGSSCCGGMMEMSGSMVGMSALGLIWMLAAAAVIIALIVLLVQGVMRT